MGNTLMALGLGYRAHSGDYNPLLEKINQVHRSLWADEEFLAQTGSGIRASTRIPVTIRLGRTHFEP